LAAAVAVSAGGKDRLSSIRCKPGDEVDLDFRAWHYQCADLDERACRASLAEDLLAHGVDQRTVLRTIIEDIWDEWWGTRFFDEPEDRHRRLPEDVPLNWPL